MTRGPAHWARVMGCGMACCEWPQGVGRAAPKGVLCIELGPPEFCVGALTTNVTLFGDRTYKEVIKVK